MPGELEEHICRALEEIGRSMAANLSLLSRFNMNSEKWEMAASHLNEVVNAQVTPSAQGTWSAKISPPIATNSLSPEVRCSECNGLMFNTPSGIVCAMGHGGTDTVSLAIPNGVVPRAHVQATSRQKVVPSWTPSQEVALDRITKWMESIHRKRMDAYAPDPGSRYFVLRGFPGTGKSFMQGYLKDTWEDRLNFAFTAPTHQACAVLSKYIDAPVATLASRLGVRAVIDEDRLNFVLPERFPDLPAFSILEVDEASQLNAEYIDFIDKLANTLNLYVLYVGDHAQLNPIGERISKVWKLCKGTEFEARLTEVRRNAGPGLPMLAALRKCIFSKNYVNPIQEFADGETIFYHETERKLLRAVRDNLDAFREGRARLLAWHNFRVDYFAGVVRTLLGYESDSFSEGERFILDGGFLPFATEEEPEFGNNGEDVVMLAQTESKFNLEREVSQFLPDWDVPYLDVLSLTLYSPSRDMSANAAYLRGSKSQSVMKRLYSELAAKARWLSDNARKNGSSQWESKQCWETFWKLKKSFVALRSGYSATAHTFQGSEAEIVFVDSQDILSNPNDPEAFRCLYTAASRFRSKIHVM